MSQDSISWASLWQQIKQHKPTLVKAHIVAIAATLISVPIPLMMPMLVDEVLLDKPGVAVGWMNQIFPSQWHSAMGYIGAILLTVMILRLLSLVLSVMQSRQFTIIGKQISLSIRQRLLTHLPQVQLREYETQGSGGISARCITDVDTLDQFISGTISKFIVAVLTLIGVAAILLAISWQLGLFILLLNPVVIYFSQLFGKQVKKLKTKENAATEAFQQALIETLDAIHQLRAIRRDGHYFAKVGEAAIELKNRAIGSQWKTEAMGRFSFTIFLLGFEVFRAVAMMMVLISDLSIGQMFAVFGYLWFMMGPVQELLNMQYSWFGAKAAIARLNAVLALPKEPSYPNGVNPFTESDAIALTLNDVSFAYSEEAPLLKQISLHVPAGETAALVSMSGGGKSTLVQLLLGLYQPQRGSIAYNDVPINTIGVDAVRANVATVLQQPALFNTSLRENLTMGADHTDDEVWQALSVAALKDFVVSLPEQLASVVGRNGVRLSGGQRQRLAIARMVLSNPKVVILDEATSALDVATEAEVLANLQQFLKARTTLIIAHRLSAIAQADRVFVLDDGVICQSGSHQQLSSVAGLYQTLYGNDTQL
ncbi:ABC transporter ATP-binding protein/permease [Neiella marina]|uniref:ABC transporter ATP-binding protein/permease n=1 Tax=Neiella holothuriorum TaxID=2870530 RepID=A0ABS7EGV3_9GAMM|nr:ABC transporter ATP-binding protein [Neiella holothuriorum]MBW8191582.1 ABC transporter ATP-binding protein/permease [Neiella holothuriorum]